MLQSDVLVVSNRRMSAGAAERMMHAANLKSESEEGMVWLDRITARAQLLYAVAHTGYYYLRLVGGPILSCPSIHGLRTSGMVTVSSSSFHPFSKIAANTLGTAMAVPFTVQG